MKRAMSHVPCIDDLIEITKTTKQASEISMLTTVVAEILLVTTARQATRMFFPITIFNCVWDMHLTKLKEFTNFFSTTGAGGWFAYKCAMESDITFTVAGNMEEEKASQIVFHSIFGTFREDLSILSQVTDVGKWFTREEMGGIFKQQGSSVEVTKIRLPRVKMYAKMACANQSGLLSGVFNQVATVPCISGTRIQQFDESFFEHVEKRRVVSTSGKSVNQLLAILTSTLNELHEKLKSANKKLEMATTK